jgi:uncharacterized protein
MHAHFVLYVTDQSEAARFWCQALDLEPSLDVPGMTEFVLGEHAVLGLMPGAGIRRLLGPDLPDPACGTPIARAELYLLVDDPAACYRRALAAGARPLSAPVPRDWGHEAGYCLDADGHVLAFARALPGR